MSWTKTQIANYINGKIKYSFNISDSYQLEFNTHDNRYDFEEFKSICKKMQNTGIGFIKIKTLDLPINGAYYTSKSLMRKHL